MLMLRLGVIVLFIGAMACGDDDEGSSPDAGDAKDASDEKDASEDVDASVDSGTAEDLKDFAIAKVDTPCKKNEERACTAHNGTERLVCTSGVWKKDAAACTGNNRCDTKLGSTQGTCLPIASECVGKKPGEAVCDAAARKNCDKDLLRYENNACSGENQMCSDADGVKCICASGYAEKDGKCEAIPGCEDKPCGDLPNTCGEASDGFSCTCGTGFVGTGSDSCEDVNECATANGGCDALTECTNTEGGRTCSACPSGYTGDGASGCDETDECATDNGGCADHATCTNTPGGRTCGCAAGYSGDGVVTCDDVDECTTSNGGCDAMVSCTNIDGGRTCGACPMYTAGTGETACTHFYTQQFGTSSEDRPQGIATDSAGNVYVAGYTTGAVAGATNAGDYDLFVTKYNAAGVSQWASQLGNANADYPYGLAVDGSGNVYVTGTTSGAFDGNTAAGQQDIFLVKYDSAGAKAWSRQYGTGTTDWALGIAVSGAGDVYVAAAFDDDIDSSTNAGGFDAGVIKYNTAGTRQWTRQFGTVADDYSYGITLDGSGNVYVAGTTEGDLDGANAGQRDWFVRKYDSAGMADWTRQVGSAALDYVRSVTTDADGNVFVVGSGGADFDGNTSAGGFDLVVVKYNSAGVKQWSKQIGSDNYDYGQGVATDASGAVYITGYSEAGFDGHTNLGAGSDAVLVKYDAAGVKQWSRQFGTSTIDVTSGLSSVGGNVFVTGSTDGTLEDRTNLGSYDGFVIKYDGSGNEL